jgi:hypothetical protein
VWIENRAVGSDAARVDVTELVPAILLPATGVVRPSNAIFGSDCDGAALT